MSKSVSIYKKENIIIVNALSNAQSHPDLEALVSEQLLHLLCPDGKITASACEKIMNFNKKEKYVKGACDLSKIKIRPDDGRVYLIINRKPISSNSYVGLVDKLYTLFFDTEEVTLESYFEEWMTWRSEETSVSPKTIKENRFLWNSLMLNQPISKIPLKDLTTKGYIVYFRSITKGRQLTRKRFNDLKSILNGILYLAVENEIIERNCLHDINYKQFSYKSQVRNIQPYNEEERLRIIGHLGDDFYSLAIKLDFHLVLRIGELKGLRWDDISSDGCIFIQRFVNDKNVIIEDIKGHSDAGKRFMPLTPTAIKILEEVKKQNPDSEYIFIRNGQPLATVTFNRHLRKCCNELGIEYRSSHKLRFSTASIMYKNGLSDTELQKLLGHSTLNMTHWYLKNIVPNEETSAKFRAILG